MFTKQKTPQDTELCTLRWQPAEGTMSHSMRVFRNSVMQFAVPDKLLSGDGGEQRFEPSNRLPGQVKWQERVRLFQFHNQ